MTSLPNCVPAHLADELLADTVAGRNILLFLSRLANVPYGFVREFCLPLALAFANAGASLLSTIRHIGLMAAQPKMVGINASRIVALVADAKIIGRSAMANFPCKPVSQSGLPIPFDAAVAVRTFRSNPEKASRVRFGDGVVVEPFGQPKFAHVDVHALIVAENRHDR